ncbi:MAG: M14 family metallopeptidase [Candidatus Obscuribacterales bacterium]|nr:M14 family metallopeptidase [Steroidobacteraceae bacterium]
MHRSKWGRYFCFVFIALHPLASQAVDAKSDLRTVAEQSDFKRTGRYDEVIKLCATFQTAWPTKVRCVEFGRTPEGRPMLALIVSHDGVLDARTARERQRPVVVMQGGIHAGEIDGKDAGFWALPELLDSSSKQSTLSKVTFVFVPVFNVDGHERFGRWNRPNQIGPEEMGWRTTAQNLNLNRDYVKAEAPEMQAMLRLLNEWDPILYADLHVTDGADFEHDISINVAPTLVGDPALQQSAVTFRDNVLQQLTAKGSLPLPFYPTLLRTDDPTSGFADNIPPPRFSHQYWALRNRIGVLVETHSWKDYRTRVRATRNAIVAMLEQAAASGTQWGDAAKAADQRASELSGKEVTLAYRNTSHSRTIDFRGYLYTRTPSPISGALMTKYDSKQPQLWRVPLYDEVQAALTVTAPRGGYIVSSAHADIVATKLTLHGIAFIKLDKSRTAVNLQAFRATKAMPSQATNEGRTTLTTEGAWRNETRDIASGSLFVPIAQVKAPLVVTLMEPPSGDSLLSWGYFNNAFERKEYMEPYVAEQVAVEMLAKDAVLKAEFEKQLTVDSAFAQSPQARLDFFYRRHSSWDERFNLYPVYRVDIALIDN